MFLHGEASAWLARLSARAGALTQGWSFLACLDALRDFTGIPASLYGAAYCGEGVVLAMVSRFGCVVSVVHRCPDSGRLGHTRAVAGGSPSCVTERVYVGGSRIPHDTNS
jgi:hypothetical protein